MYNRLKIKNPSQTILKRSSNSYIASVIHMMLIGSTIISTSLATPTLLNAAELNVAYDIPATNLEDALNVFAKQSGITLSFDPALVRGIKTTSIKGKYTKEQTLKKLLNGSNLEPVTKDGIVVIQVNGTVSTLPEVSVLGEKEKSHNLLKVYAGGQVARGGSLGVLGNRDFMDTPFNQTNFTSELIQNQQARSVGDVFKNDPSVRSVRGPGDLAESYLIRGFQIFATEFAVNGLYGAGPGQNIATESVERVELFKGPNALLNGMSVYGGVGGSINVVTKKAGMDPLYRVTGTYSGNNVWGAQVDAGRRFGSENELGIRVNAAHREGDTAVDRQTERADILSVGLDYQADRWRVLADIGYQARHRGSPISQLYIADGVKVPHAPDLNKNYQQKWEYQETRDTYGMIKSEFDLTKNWTTFLNVGGSDGLYVDQRNIMQVLDSAGNTDAFPIYNSFGSRKNSSIAVGVNGLFETGFIKHTVNLSFNTLHIDAGSSLGGNLGPGVSSYIYQYVATPEVTRGEAGISSRTLKSNRSILSSLAIADTLSILDDQVQLILGARKQRVRSDNYDITTGLRDVANSYDEDKITPAVGFVVKPIEHVSVYGNYIEGLSQGPSAPPGSANFPKVFPPIQTEQMELGMKFDFGKFAATISAYQIKQPNAFTNPVTLVYALNGEQKNKGIELNVFGEPIEHVRVLGGVAFNNNRLSKTEGGLNEGNIAAGSPHTQLNIGGEWDVLPEHGLTLTSLVQHSSEQYVSNENIYKIPSYSVFDFGARYRFIASGKPVVVRADLKNAFDKDYYSSAGNGLILGYPRTLYVSTSLDF